MKNTARVEYLDIAKGIGIIMVVLGHAYLLPTAVFRVIFSVHMPLFFILSGSFFRFRTGDSFRNFLVKNIKGLLVPYGLTAGMIILLKMVYALFRQGNVLEELRLWVFSALYGSGARIPAAWSGSVNAIGVIWFLLALFVGRILLALILYSRVPWLWALILFFASYISTDLFWLPFSIQPGFCSVLFLYLGYEIGRHHMFDPKGIRFPVRILAAGVWVYCMVNCGILCMVENVYQNHILDLIGAVCGTMTIVYLSQLVERFVPLLRRALAFLGRISLGIMCAHLIALTCFPRTWVIDFLQERLPWPSWVCDALVVAVITAVITLILYYIPWMNRYLFPAKRLAVHSHNGE